MSNAIHVNNVGVEFRITLEQDDVVIDVSSATVTQIIFRKPSGEMLTYDVDFYTDGTDGILTYTSIDGDLDEGGNYRIQAYCELDTRSFYSAHKNERSF